MKWIKIVDRLPQEEVEVETKIEGRNIQRLKRLKNLWFLPDMSTYVYYTPTHWRPV